MTSPQRKSLFPLWSQVLCGVGAGVLFGVAFKTTPFAFGFGNEHLGQLGVLVIKLLKALAIPLILFAILDAFVKTRFTFRQGGRLVLFCLMNVSVAMALGLLIMNTLRPGVTWQGRLDEMLGDVDIQERQSEAEKLISDSHKGTLKVVDNIASYVPKSLVDPFSENSVISVVLIALFTGAALRSVKDRGDVAAGVRTLEQAIEAIYQILIQMVEWAVRMVPFAVFGVMAQVVGKSGLHVFVLLWTFLWVMLAGLVIHSLIYYPLVAWFLGGKSPREYVGQGMDAILTALSCNSSLATVPVTLKCLDRMGVSPQSARMAACVGTNLNNDGITLYEAMAALFLAQAVGIELGLPQQLALVLSSIMAGAGVAGIPEAGLVVLPLVLTTAGLPEPVIAAAIPLIMTVDWIIARARSGVNVMSDMLIAILLDTGGGPLKGDDAFSADGEPLCAERIEVENVPAE